MVSIAQLLTNAGHLLSIVLLSAEEPDTDQETDRLLGQKKTSSHGEQEGSDRVSDAEEG